MREQVVDVGVRPIRNRCRRPRANTGYGLLAGGVALSTVTDTAASGGSFLRLMRTSTTGVIGGLAYTDTPYPSATSGERLTILWRVRSSIATSVRSDASWRDANRAGVGGTAQGPGVTLVANQWTWVSATHTVPATAGITAVEARITDVSNTWTPTDTFDIDACAILEGTASDYADGDTPGWQWTGTAGASDSVGYPYTLESIAGKPLADLSAPGTVTPGLPISRDALTVYLAATRLQDAGQWFDNYGVNASGNGFSKPTGFAIQENQSGVGGVQARYDYGPTGGSNLGRTSTVPVGSPAVVTALLTANQDSFRLAVNGTVSGAATQPPANHTGVEVNTVAMAAASTFTTPHRLLVYKGSAHDDTTMKRVTAWLARKYGSTIPSGY